MDPKKLNKYLYIEQTPTWLIKLIYSVGLLTWGGVIYGYSKFYYEDPLFFFIVGPLILFLIVYHILSYSITLCYKQFDLKAHHRLLADFDLKNLSSKAGEYPAVDVFLPICGEETDVIRNTFEAVSQLDYSNFKVYVLDDRGDSDHRSLAHHYGFIYMSRENKGEMKKAGNLKHGFERSNGDFIVVYDADFAPHPDFITELLPYMRNPKVAIVQSPQYFQTDREVHKTSALQYGAAHVQEDFYRFIQVARSRLGAPICCGSNAIYRRTALDTIGGTVQIEHSEDAYTGFELSNYGYRVQFIPIILAIGLCPDNLHSYFHQQHRWCSGSLSLMLSKRFWHSKLTVWQKLCFISGFMYYLSHPVTILLSLQIFVLLFFYADVANLWNALPFIPCILFSFIVIPQFRITRQRFGGFLARNSYLFSYTHATLVALFKKSVGWQPTNTKRSDVSKEYLEQLHFIALYFLVYMTLVGFSVGMGTINVLNVQTYSLLFWVFYNIISTAIILCYLYFLMSSIKKRQVRSTNEKVLWQIWQLKTGGIYISTLLILVFSAGFYGSAYKGLLAAVSESPSPEDLFAESTPQLMSDAQTVATTTLENLFYNQNTLLLSDDLVLYEIKPQIRELQHFLNTNGHPLSDSGYGSLWYETDYFGVLTYKALKSFQRSSELTETGEFDFETREFIKQDFSTYVF